MKCSENNILNIIGVLAVNCQHPRYSTIATGLGASATSGRIVLTANISDLISKGVLLPLIRIDSDGVSVNNPSGAVVAQNGNGTERVNIADAVKGLTFDLSAQIDKAKYYSFVSGATEGYFVNSDGQIAGANMDFTANVLTPLRLNITGDPQEANGITSHGTTLPTPQLSFTTPDDFIFANQAGIENFFDYEPYAIENFKITEVSNVVTIKGFTKSGKQIMFTEATNLISTDDLGTAITFTPTTGALVSSALGATATLLSVYGIANGFIFNENVPV